MVHSELQKYYLDAMGIERWVKRERKLIDSPSTSSESPMGDIQSKSTLLSKPITISQSTFIETEVDTINSLNQLAKEVSQCIRCPLHQGRTNTVFSRGNANAELMIIGEAPGFYEDKQGLPFVGKAGALLNQMLLSIGFTEETVYIANVLKCRPPNNRDPSVDEIEQCKSYLNEQIKLIKPKLILGLGRFASQFLTKKTSPLSQARQKMHTYEQTPCLISYHPAYLLRNPKDKKKSFMDLIQVRRFFD